MANWLYNSLLKQWCEENGVIYKEEKEMTKCARVMIKRICDELSKWCDERNVMCEFATTDDEGMTCTFSVGGTTLTVNHVETRDLDKFSKYVKFILFGDINMIDKLKEEVAEMNDKILKLKEQIDKKDACIGRLEREDKEKAKDIEYLEGKVKELNNIIVDRDLYIEELRNDISSLAYQLDIERDKISELEDQYDDKCKAFIDMCKHYDSEVTKRMKAEDELKAERHDDVVDVTRYLVVLGKKKRAEEMIKSLKNRVNDDTFIINKLKGQIEGLNKDLNDLEKARLKILVEDDAVIDVLKKKNATLQYKIDALENDVKDITTSFKKDLDAKTKENLDLDNNVKDMFATIRSLKKEIKDKDNEIADLVARLLSATDNMSKNENYLAEILKENTSLRDANGFLSVKLEKRDEVIEALKTSYDELKKENATLKYKVDALGENKKDLLSSYKNDLNNKNSEIDELKAEIETLLEKNYNLDNHVKNLVAQEEILKREINALEYKNARIFGLWKNSDKPSIGIDLNLSELKKDIDEALKSLDERIAWMEDHMDTAENDIARSIEKLGGDQKKIFHDTLNIFTRLAKLEEAQPKKASRKTQKSTLS